MKHFKKTFHPIFCWKLLDIFFKCFPSIVKKYHGSFSEIFLKHISGVSRKLFTASQKPFVGKHWKVHDTFLETYFNNWKCTFQESCTKSINESTIETFHGKITEEFVRRFLKLFLRSSSVHWNLARIFQEIFTKITTSFWVPVALSIMQ